MDRTAILLMLALPAPFADSQEEDLVSELADYLEGDSFALQVMKDLRDSYDLYRNNKASLDKAAFRQWLADSHGTATKSAVFQSICLNGRGEAESSPYFIKPKASKASGGGAEKEKTVTSYHNALWGLAMLAGAEAIRGTVNRLLGQDRAAFSAVTEGLPDNVVDWDTYHTLGKKYQSNFMLNGVLDDEDIVKLCQSLGIQTEDTLSIRYVKDDKPAIKGLSVGFRNDLFFTKKDKKAKPASEESKDQADGKVETSEGPVTPPEQPVEGA